MILALAERPVNPAALFCYSGAESNRLGSPVPRATGCQTYPRYSTALFLFRTTTDAADRPARRICICGTLNRVKSGKTCDLAPNCIRKTVLAEAYFFHPCYQASAFGASPPGPGKILSSFSKLSSLSVISVACRVDSNCSMVLGRRKKTDHSFGLLKRLNQSVQKNSIKTTVTKFDAILMVFAEGVHELAPVWSDTRKPIAVNASATLNSGKGLRGCRTRSNRGQLIR